MSPTTKHKYTESHWMVFALQGVAMMLSGLYIMFTSREDVVHMTLIIGITLLVLACTEILNVIHRKRRQRNWGIALGIAIFELAIGSAMLIGLNTAYEFHIALLAGYTIIRSVSSIVAGFTAFTNMTDRFIWVVSGMVGCVLGFAILADPGLSEVMFARLFSTYMLIFGLTDIIFAIHSRDELGQEKEERAERRRLLAKKTKKGKR